MTILTARSYQRGGGSAVTATWAAVIGGAMGDDYLTGSRVSIDFTSEELAVLTRVLGINLFWLRTDTFPIPTAGSERDVVLGLAHRALVARRVLSVGDEPAVLPAVARMLGIMAAPLLVVEIARRERNHTTHSYFAAIPEATIGQEPVGDGIHRFTPFPTSELLAQAVHAARLEERPPVAGKPFRVAASALRAALAAGEEGDGEAVASGLGRAGAASEDARLFSQALSSRLRVVSVTVVHRPATAVVAGGEIAWIDGNDAGLWGVPTAGNLGPDPDGEDPPCSVFPTTAAALGASILSFLPGAGPHSTEPAGAPAGGA